MTDKMYSQAEEIKVMIETMQEEESLTEQEYIDRVVYHFRDEFSTVDDRLAVYMHLHKQERYGGNWYWLVRRIRNTGQVRRLAGLE